LQQRHLPEIQQRSAGIRPGDLVSLVRGT